MTETVEGEPTGRRLAVAGWFRRPGRSLTRRLIWLASGWIALALVVTGLVLTSQFQESGLRRLGNVLDETLVRVIAVTTTEGDVVVTPQIQDQRTLDIFSGKYWSVAERRGTEPCAW